MFNFIKKFFRKEKPITGQVTLEPVPFEVHDIVVYANVSPHPLAEETREKDRVMKKLQEMLAQEVMKYARIKETRDPWGRKNIIVELNVATKKEGENKYGV
jgi:hypothetical protein